MRQTICAVFISGILFLSCKKSTTNPTPVTPVSTFEFTFNGTNYLWKGYSTDPNVIEGSKIIKNLNSSPGGYRIEASNGAPSNSMVLQVTSGTSNLSLGTFTYIKSSGSPSSGEMAISGSSYWCEKNGDFSTVTITKLESGYASGTFSVKMTKYSNSSSAVVTNGVFTNIKIEN